MKKIIILLVCILSTSAFAQKPDWYDECYVNCINQNSDQILQERNKNRDLHGYNYELKIDEFSESFVNGKTVYEVASSQLLHNDEVINCEIPSFSITSGSVLRQIDDKNITCGTTILSFYLESNTLKLYAYLFAPNTSKAFALAKAKIVDEDYLAWKKQQETFATAASKAAYMQREMQNHPVSTNF